MRDYPRRVYLSTSWDGSHRPLSDYLVAHLVRNGLTVIGDHPEYKRDDPFGRPWPQRADGIIRDCGGLVAVFPLVHNAQTTTPNMFPELLSAFVHGIPVMLFIQTGVVLRSRKVTGGYNLQFGTDTSLRTISWNDLESSRSAGELERLLISVGTIRLQGESYLDGPHLVPSSTSVAQSIDDFSKNRVKNPRSTYVFNILPFSMRKREHREIARAVFEETGLPCHISLDQIDISSGMRRQWQELVAGAEFCIADFSMIRDACLFEIGVFFGHHKKIFIVAKGKIPHLPFGPDDLPVLAYGNLAELRRIVRERCCAEYKRKVYNLDPDIVHHLTAPNAVGGLPKELFSTPHSANMSRDIAWAGWLTSVAVGLVIWWIIVIAGATDSPAAGIGILVSFTFGFVSTTRELRQAVEERMGERSRALLIGSVIGLAAAALLLLGSYLRVPPFSRADVLESGRTALLSSSGESQEGEKEVPTSP